MKTLTLRKRQTPKKPLDETGGATEGFITESVVCLEGGVPRIVYVEGGGNAGAILSHLARELRAVKFPKDDRSRGMPSQSRVFGYQPRITIRRDFCTAALFNSDHRPALELLVRAGMAACESYRLYAPEKYASHKKQADTLAADWRIPGTPFTSGIINLNTQYRYHFDSGNVKGGWSAMWVMKKGITGGHLHCPEYGVTFDLKNNSLLLFDGQSILHGVTPITRAAPDSYRLSVVYYALARMWKCLAPGAELARIRKVRTERERKRAQ